MKDLVSSTSSLQSHPVTQNILLRGSVQPILVNPTEPREGLSGCWEGPTPLDNCKSFLLRVLKSFRVILRDPFSSLRGELWFCFLIPPIPYSISFRAFNRSHYRTQPSSWYPNISRRILCHFLCLPQGALLHFLPMGPQTSFSLHLPTLISAPFFLAFLSFLEAAATLILNQHRSHKVLSGLLFSLKEELGWGRVQQGWRASKFQGLPSRLQLPRFLLRNAVLSLTFSVCITSWLSGNVCFAKND